MLTCFRHSAFQAIENKGIIKIKSFADEKTAYIKISDSGKGISPGNLSKIFDPGFTTKGAGVGWGLGLSISYKIIHEHGDTISAESHLEHGTEFTISLPIV